MKQRHKLDKDVTSVKSYIFRVELVGDKDGRWSVRVPTLPGCATWGYTKAEALRNIQDGVELYVRDMQEAGEAIPADATTQVIDQPVVAVTI